MDQAETFTHHGSTFVLEAEDWPSGGALTAAMIALQSWVLEFDAAQTAALHAALEEEREALMQEVPYDRDAPLLASVRQAQRQAIRTGLQGQSAGDLTPLLSLEAQQQG